MSERSADTVETTMARVDDRPFADLRDSAWRRLAELAELIHGDEGPVSAFANYVE